VNRVGDAMCRHYAFRPQKHGFATEQEALADARNGEMQGATYRLAFITLQRGKQWSWLGVSAKEAAGFIKGYVAGGGKGRGNGLAFVEKPKRSVGGGDGDDHGDGERSGGEERG